MSTVRIVEESLLVEVSVEPRLTVDGARLLLVTIIAHRIGIEWNAPVALANEVRVVQAAGHGGRDVRC